MMYFEAAVETVKRDLGERWKVVVSQHADVGSHREPHLNRRSFAVA